MTSSPRSLIFIRIFCTRSRFPGPPGQLLLTLPGCGTPMLVSPWNRHRLSRGLRTCRSERTAGRPACLFHDNGRETHIVGAFGHERIHQMTVDLGIHVVDVGLDDDRCVFFSTGTFSPIMRRRTLGLPGCPCSLRRWRSGLWSSGEGGPKEEASVLMMAAPSVVSQAR